MRKKLFYTSLAGFFLLIQWAGFGQKPDKTILKAVQPGYFLFPIMPGEANSLSGGLGDLRPNHFHAGIDIRTAQREGLDVYAAADGYISRIAVFTGGYGNVVFIKHPNGLTTVYGHLKTLNDTLGQYLRAEQYKKQTFEIDLRPEPNQFPVKKGQIIALSGNTGGSGGPHLHFEIRDDKNNLLNPLLFGFEEIEDNVPPFFERIALQPLTPTSRVNGQAGRLALTPVRQSNGTYVLTQPVSASGLIGLEVLAHDRTSGSPFKNGLTCIEIQLDDQEVFAYNMNNFPNEETRLINLHMNYGIEQLTGQRFHRCYIADGNTLNLYRYDQRQGKLPLFDGKPHEVRITLYDCFQHTTSLRFTVLPETENAVLGKLTPSKSPTVLSSSVEENTLIIRARNFPTAEAPTAQVFMKNAVMGLGASYIRANEAYYIIDLQKNLPDSVQIGKAVLPLNFRKRILPGKADTYRDSSITVAFGPESLYDTLHLAVSTTGNRLTINQGTIALKDHIEVDFIPAEPVEDPRKTQMYLINGKRRYYVGGFWKNNHFQFRSRQLGTFQLLTDPNPPTVKFLRKDHTALVATVKDDLSGLDTVRAMVNGEWILMQYDYKRALVWSDKLDPAKPFEGSVVLEAKDRAGNVTTVTVLLPPAPRPMTVDSSDVRENEK
ncbi:M23 family metallopeptidase [Larkinella arboricola]|uniref:M23 family metallopeptidase n=1 Tax=Larkinella arboricola TaxID=643671 RepID=UPI001E3A23A3|nr:M23 family metallopeptidase [Larkinella arboricola]